jgi:hypothetical protein
MLRRLPFSSRIRRINNCLSFSNAGDICVLDRMFQTSLPRLNTKINDGDFIAKEVRLLMRRVTQPGTLALLYCHLNPSGVGDN